MSEKKIAIILGIMSLLIATLIAVQIRTIKEASSTVGGTTLNDNSNLKDEVLEWQQKYNTAYAKLEKTQQELENIRTEAITGNEADKTTETELKTINTYLGLTEVSGEGLVITLDDNRSVNENEILNITQYLVHQEDLVSIVNELFNAGADAVSINGKRVVSTTAILCDGNIIRINGEITGVPITIKAIGYAVRLKYALTRPGGYLSYMENDGVVVKSETSDTITIPKYEGLYVHDYILN